MSFRLTSDDDSYNDELSLNDRDDTLAKDDEGGGWSENPQIWLM